MATLKLYRNKLRHNYKRLKKLLDHQGYEFAIVTKLLCGNKDFLTEVVSLGDNAICDSRLSNLKTIKKINPAVETIYIKPPAKSAVSSIVKFADISLNTQYETIKLLSKEAQKLKKLHKVIIMVEMGDLREGVMKKDLLSFYQKVFKLKGIKVVGIGTNLNCLHGVMPSADKLVQLALYKQIIELKFNRKIPLISGGTTVTLPLVKRKQMPNEVNHFRIGEALYFGADLFSGETLPGFYPSVFELKAQIIELQEKPQIPEGELAKNPSGEVFEVDESKIGKVSNRAIIDIGLLDVNPEFLIPENENVKLIGASSDMLVVDLGENGQDMKVGDYIKFQMKYMGALSILNSRYIDKVVI